MDNEICKVTNLYYFEPLYKLLKIICIIPRDSEFLESLDFLSYIWNDKSSTEQREWIGVLRRISRRLFCERLHQLLSHCERIRSLLEEKEPDLYRETIDYFAKCRIPQDQYNHWSYQILRTLREITHKSAYLVLNEYMTPFNQIYTTFISKEK